MPCMYAYVMCLYIYVYMPCVHVTHAHVHGNMFRFTQATHRHIYKYIYNMYTCVHMHVCMCKYVSGEVHTWHTYPAQIRHSKKEIDRSRDS